MYKYRLVSWKYTHKISFISYNVSQNYDFLDLEKVWPRKKYTDKILPWIFTIIDYKFEVKMYPLLFFLDLILKFKMFQFHVLGLI